MIHLGVGSSRNLGSAAIPLPLRASIIRGAGVAQPRQRMQGVRAARHTVEPCVRERRLLTELACGPLARAWGPQLTSWTYLRRQRNRTPTPRPSTTNVAGSGTTLTLM